MGNYSITVQGAGIHHNGRSNDVEQMAARFVDDLNAAGNRVTRAVVTIGSENDLVNRRSELLAITAGPSLPPTHVVGVAESGGQLAYRGYCAASGNKSLVSGAELPAWDALSHEVRSAWEAAAHAVHAGTPEIAAG